MSLRLYPHNDLSADAIVDELCAQAALGAAHGFDGVMTSEHHAGLPRLPAEPVAGRGLVPRVDGARVGRAVTAPVAAPPATLVAEEVAWLAARFPGRVGLGVASGALSRRTSR